MPELIVRFTRLTNDRHRFEFVRPDGTGEAVELETRSTLFHDLVHFAVESEAGLQGSFYGLLAKLGGYAELTLAGASLGGEAAMTETVVGPMQGAMKGEFDPDAFVDRVREIREDMDIPPILWLSPDLIRRAHARLRQLEGQWRATPFHQTMELRFPLRG